MLAYLQQQRCMEGRMGRRWTRAGKKRKGVTASDEYACYETNFLTGKNWLILRTLHGLKIHL